MKSYLQSMTFRPFQEEDAAWLAAQPVGFLLHDPRVGKTVTALHACRLMGAERIAVVTKAILKEQWCQMKHRWCPEPKLLVESYDKLALDITTRRTFARFRPDVLIVDEGQRVKNPDAKRTKALYGVTCERTAEGIAHFADKLWVLSGTLTPNHLGEAWTHLRAMGRTPWSYTGFLERFCVVVDTQYGRKVVGLRRERIPEFVALMRPITRRRRFREVFPHHAAPRWTTLSLAAEGEDRKKLSELNHDLAVRRFTDTFRSAATLEVREALLAGSRVHPHLAAIRNRLATIKAPMIAELVDDLLESGVPKVVVFAWHHAMLDILHKHLAKHNVVRVDGRVDAAARTRALHDFQEGSARVFLGQTTTAGEGIPLHAARVMVLAEYPWSLGEVVQTAQRIVSADVDSQPEIIVPLVQGTIDEQVAETLLRKVEHAQVLHSLGER